MGIKVSEMPKSTSAGLLPSALKAAGFAVAGPAGGMVGGMLGDQQQKNSQPAPSMSLGAQPDALSRRAESTANDPGAMIAAGLNVAHLIPDPAERESVSSTLLRAHYKLNHGFDPGEMSLGAQAPGDE